MYNFVKATYQSSAAIGGVTFPRTPILYCRGLTGYPSLDDLVVPLKLKNSLPP